MTPLAALLQEVWNILQNPLLVVFVYPKHGVEFLLEVHVSGKSWICFVHVMKACSWSRGVTPFINLGSRLMWVVSFTLWLLLHLGKELTVPIGWEAGWVPEPLWMFWRREKFMALARNWTPDYPARILVTVLMTLSRLISVLGLDTVTSQIILLLLKLVSKEKPVVLCIICPSLPPLTLKGAMCYSLWHLKFWQRWWWRFRWLRCNTLSTLKQLFL